MSPRVQADRVQKRLRTPRIPKFSSHSVLFSKALMKSVSLFIQGFFISPLLFRFVQTPMALFITLI